MEATPTTTQWETVKEVVRNLYLDRNMKLGGDDGLIKTMESEHGFRAT